MDTLERLAEIQAKEPKLPPITEEAMLAAGFLTPGQTLVDALPKRLEENPNAPKK